MDIREFFTINNKVAIAFSGGVDSSYLLQAAKEAGADFTAYYVNGPFQPEFEFEDAKRLAADVGARLVVLKANQLTDERVVSNPSNRCYYCKQKVFGLIMEAAKADGYTVICDGTNASDDASDRPGMKALQELQVKSPLRECGLTKSDVRRLSKEAGLFTWDKPSYACLATRIPTGSVITPWKLERTEKAENFMFSLGFTDFRVRMPKDDTAKIQLPADQMQLFLDKREEIVAELKKYYKVIVLDAVAR